MYCSQQVFAYTEGFNTVTLAQVIGYKKIYACLFIKVRDFDHQIYYKGTVGLLDLSGLRSHQMFITQDINTRC